jgi:hypothetical protein
MHLCGDLFGPRFQPDTGLHFIKDKKIERVCLIESAAPPFQSYEPPADIDRPGPIARRGAPGCRLFDREKNSVRDGVLGTRPWTSAGVQQSIEELTAERLERLIEEATQ